MSVQACQTLLYQFHNLVSCPIIIIRRFAKICEHRLLTAVINLCLINSAYNLAFKINLTTTVVEERPHDVFFFIEITFLEIVQRISISLQVFSRNICIFIK
jgi:hypothetical protein